MWESSSLVLYSKMLRDSSSIRFIKHLPETIKQEQLGTIRIMMQHVTSKELISPWNYTCFSAGKMSNFHLIEWVRQRDLKMLLCWLWERSCLYLREHEWLKTHKSSLLKEIDIFGLHLTLWQTWKMGMVYCGYSMPLSWSLGWTCAG